ncbi:polysaccharide deacetylase family protein [Lentibacillus sp. N15]|uniref:polysaccharide deacetylase family protein n=1 Tax=Lentibacillus songyuanensis TaxID=3136161 RepID=UPI0031BAF073
MRRRLNIKGKIAVAVLLVTMLVLLFGLTGMSKKNTSSSDEKVVQPTPLETLSYTFEPMKAFADSTLNQSVIVEQRNKEELARQQAVAEQNQADQEQHAIYLTFDDGPSKVSHQLLNTLDKYQMKATFFMLGLNMKDHSDVVKRMKNEGFGLGLHGITHQAGKIYANPAAPVKEMTKDQQILVDIAGVKSKLVRLPYGSVPYLTEDMRDLLREKDFKIWDWNVDSRDWELKNKQYVQQTIEEIQQLEQAGETPVILMHDRPETVQHLSTLLNYIRKQGYQTKVLTNDMPAITFPCEGRCYSIN